MNLHFNSFDEINFDELLDINSSLSKFPVVQLIVTIATVAPKAYPSYQPTPHA